ncbi:ABC transporter permease [Opitutus terrae]|uniref:Permease n=1 Tax=Opitutus terrae (strain DSM 11246 / JCM 15787 / PB90-1) TaxID=452637 RepID=B1ZXV6_OPITP|nr:ABC transporter permease [Opitutus terrae]ACB75158.1 permease [Opitutus terrae PB90-1]
MCADLRFALRQLLKSPGFTAIAVLTLALGIGANTAIFSVVNAVLLQPLPYPDPDRLVQIAENRGNGAIGGSDGGVFLDWQSQTTQIDFIAAFHNIDRNLTADADPIRVSGGEVSAHYLDALGVKPLLGRGFVEADDAPGGNRYVVILSHEFWQSYFRGNPAILDRTVQMDGQNYTIIGVLPPGALLTNTVNFLSPATIRTDEYKTLRNYNYGCNVIGRLKPGATAEQATAELATARKAILSEYPSFRQNWTVAVRSLHESIYGNTRPFLVTLLAAVGAVLLIACANVANLLLVRATSRQGEIAVRVAMGASTARIVRQFLTESLLIALLGGIAGIFVGLWSINPLLRYTALNTIPGVNVQIDLTVLGFTVGAAALTGLLFGLFPALSAARPNVQGALKEGTRGTSSGSRKRLQGALVISETALTVVLLVCAGLLLRSFMQALNADTGFNRDNVAFFNLTQPASKAPTIAHRTRFIADVLRNLRQIPGVSFAGMASSTPMNGRTGFGDVVSREDQPNTRDDLRAGFDSADGEYFQTFGIPLLRGRFFSEADNRAEAPRVMIINDTLARQLFGEADPLGQLIHFKDAAWEIVGVVGSVRQLRLDLNPFPHLYVPPVHFPWHTMFAVRTQVSPLTLADELRGAVRQVDPQIPIANLTTLDLAVERSLQGRRTVMGLLVIFAAVALVLACIGIYGVMSYSVSQRTRELGIRIALGAATHRVLSLVLHDGLKLVLLGLMIGIAASFGAAQLIASQLYATSQTDFTVLLAVSLVLLVVALLASWLPARRATRVNPVEALRAE